MGSTSQINNILDKITSRDKDFRYMATSDLLNELQKPNFTLDPDQERKIAPAVLKQLEDTSSDITGLAVRCLGLLAGKLSSEQLEATFTALCDKIVATGKKDNNRDIASIGLKSMLGAVNDGAVGTVVAQKVTPRLMQGIITNTQGDVDIVSECLGILQEVVSKFGHLMGDDYSALQHHLLHLLDDSRSLLRKRSMHCLAALAPYMPDDQLDTVAAVLVQKLDGASAAKHDLQCTYVQAIASLCHAVGYRFGRHLDRSLPSILKYSKTAEESDDEIREYCLQAAENFVACCPKHSKPHVDTILDLAIENLSYDPNFTGDAMEEDGDDDGLEDEEGDDYDEQYSDDEDMSWKVRRAACKCIAATLLSFPDQLPAIYTKVAAVLVTRFKEREESVRVDVAQTYITLLQQIGNAAAKYPANAPDSPVQLLAADVDRLLSAVVKQLRDKSQKTKVSIAVLLKELVMVVPESVAGHLQDIMPSVKQLLMDRASTANLKIELLLFVKLAMARNRPEVFQPHIGDFAEAVFAAVADPYYKVTAEALRVCEQLVFVMRPDTSAPLPLPLSPIVEPLHRTVMSRVLAQDQDQEVKEAAISAAATMIARLADVLGAGVVADMLCVLDERLQNEVTRLAAVKAFAVICASSLCIDVSVVAADVLSQLTSFLRKANRPLRQSSLLALQALFAAHAKQLSNDGVCSAMVDASELMNDSDLHLTTLALNVCATAVAAQPACVHAIVQKVMGQLLKLVTSPLLQGAALDALLQLLSAVIAADVAVFPDVLRALLNASQGSGKVAQQNAARCVAQLCSAAGSDKVSSTVAHLVNMVSGTKEGEQKLALHCLGELGRRVDLTQYPAAEACVTSALKSQSAEIKAAASTALGGLTIGNLPKYLPSLMKEIGKEKNTPKQQYLLLKALNEVIRSVAFQGHEAVELFKREQNTVIQMLLDSSESEEECRTVVAECLGHFSLLNPAILDVLTQNVKSPSEHMRAIVVTAVKHAIIDEPHAIDAQLLDKIIVFLSLIEDSSCGVRKAAVQAFSTAARNKPAIVLPHLPQLLKALYSQTKKDPSLIRKVDLGPFKHDIDDGLELRKAVFECMDVLIDVCWEKIDTVEFVQNLATGLTDDYDVKLPCHLMLVKLSQHAPHAVLSHIDKLVELLQKTLDARVKSTAVEQEVDRHEDMLRSCLTAVYAISKIPESKSSSAFNNLINRINANMKDRYAAVQHNASATKALDAMDTSA